jgi:hypothetical protein
MSPIHPITPTFISEFFPFVSKNPIHGSIFAINKTFHVNDNSHSYVRYNVCSYEQHSF